MIPSAPLRMASYNIQKCVGMDLRRRPNRIAQVLEGLGAALVVLQEADKRLPPRPAALPHFMLEDSGWNIVDVGGAGSLGWHGNAVIWRANAGITLREAGHIALPGLEPRGAVRAEFDTPIGPLRVIGLHLGLIAFFRRQQIQHLSQVTADMAQMPTIWAGDFNEWSAQPVLDRVAGNMKFLPPRPSFPALRPVAPLDRIALSHGLASQAHGVWRERPAQVASDHLPIWVDLLAAP